MAETLQQALAHHQAGRLQEAKMLYQGILEKNPNHPDALHLLGVLALQVGSVELAEGLMRQAIALQPKMPAYYNSLGNALSQQQQYQAAIETYHHAIRLAPQSDEAYINMGNALHAQGNLQQALQQYQQAKQLNPACAETYNNLGNVLKDLEDFESAEQHYQKALELNPTYAEAYYNLACLLTDRKRYEAAILNVEKALRIFPDFRDAVLQLGLLYGETNQNDAAFQCCLKAIELDPSDAEGYYQAGFILQKQLKLEEALSMYRQALQYDPNMVLAHFHMGLVHSYLKKDDLAISCYEKALALDPNLPEAYFNLGNIAKRKNRLDEALAYYQTTLKHQPEYVDAWVNQASVLEKMNRPEEAIACYEKAYAIDPRPGIQLEIATLLPGIYRSQEELMRWRQRFDEKVQALLQQGLTLKDPLQEFGRPNFYLTYQGMNDRAQQIAFAKLFDSAPQWPYRPHPKHAKPRLGFISANFRSKHTIGKLNRGLIEHISREKFDVTVLTIGEDYLENNQLPISPQDRYIHLPPDQLEEAARQVAEQELDLLLYADIGMEPMSYFLSRSRLAKVQCVTWGHPETTGHANMDYFLSSRDFEVPHAQEHYSETLVRLQELYPYYPRLTLDRPKTRADFGYGETDHLYTCLQSLFKFHPDFDEVLAAILDRDPQAKIILLHHSYKPYNKILLERWAHRMPHTQHRIEFVDRLPRQDFMNLMALSDVMLDPLHFGGGNTSLEAFAFGTPVVTLPSEFLRCRLTDGYYRKMGMADCVAQSIADYVEIAVRLGTDRTYREQISQKIMQNNHVLFENMAAVYELEAFFLWAIGKAYGDGPVDPPDGIWVGA